VFDAEVSEKFVNGVYFSSSSSTSSIACGPWGGHTKNVCERVGEGRGGRGET